MVDVAGWAWTRLYDLKPGQHVLYKGDELKVKAIGIGSAKSRLKVSFVGADPLDARRDTEIRVVNKST